MCARVVAGHPHTQQASSTTSSHSRVPGTTVAARFLAQQQLLHARASRACTHRREAQGAGAWAHICVWTPNPTAAVERQSRPLRPAPLAARCPSTIVQPPTHTRARVLRSHQPPSPQRLASLCARVVKLARLCCEGRAGQHSSGSPAAGVLVGWRQPAGGVLPQAGWPWLAGMTAERRTPPPLAAGTLSATAQRPHARGLSSCCAGGCA
jgi:hypothetical protein